MLCNHGGNQSHVKRYLFEFYIQKYSRKTRFFQKRSKFRPSQKQKESENTISWTQTHEKLRPQLKYNFKKNFFLEKVEKRKKLENFKKNFEFGKKTDSQNFLQKVLTIFEKIHAHIWADLETKNVFFFCLKTHQKKNSRCDILGANWKF